MLTKETLTSTKHIIAVLLAGSNLVKFTGFLFTCLSLTFYIGYYFGCQSELNRHSTEINLLNLEHGKQLNAEIDKRRAIQDNKYQEQINDLKTTVSYLKNRIK
ncbi:MAG: hypothetical protein JWP94_3303 [Mucilaginibacter sp.]|nr:hypothetical protein [Mucilaginibacter sp.]